VSVSQNARYFVAALHVITAHLKSAILYLTCCESKEDLVLVALKRTIWQRLLWWRFRLFQQHRHERLVLEWVAGRPLIVLPGVMNPALFRTGPFLARELRRRVLPAGAVVLDMGTGSGLLAITAAERAGQVTAVDINPEAVRCARVNTLLNRVEGRVTVRQGDLFAPVTGERFDLILFNPPFFSGEPDGLFDQAWRSNNIARRFAEGLPGHLAPEGEALVVLSSLGKEAAFVEAFQETGLDVTVAARGDLTNELLTVYRLALPARREES
jgi:HemK-related putative methylase